jgi:hypothetical protein
VIDGINWCCEYVAIAVMMRVQQGPVRGPADHAPFIMRIGSGIFTGLGVAPVESIHGAGAYQAAAQVVPAILPNVVVADPSARRATCSDTPCLTGEGNTPSRHVVHCPDDAKFPGFNKLLHNRAL